MLTELTIRNFAIIDELHVNFAPGLNIITGETGAGKSIIIGAIGLLLGDKSSVDMIRTGEDSAMITASFDIGDNAPVKDILHSWDMECEDKLIIRRVVSRSGRNRIYINGIPGTLSMLSHIAEHLLEICGQHEHQTLLKEENHLEILDRFGKLVHLREDYNELFDRVSSLENEIQQLRKKVSGKEVQSDFLHHQIAEIDRINPIEGEEEALTEERRVLMNIQKLLEASRTAYDIIYGAKDSILDRLSVVISFTHEIKKIDPRFTLQEVDLDNLYYQLEDVAHILRDYSSQISSDPDRLDLIENRLNELGRLKRKYGGDIKAVLKCREEMMKELEELNSAEYELRQLESLLEENRKVLLEKALELSRARQKTAEILEKLVEVELHSLRMPGSKFSVVFKRSGLENNIATPGRNGLDSVAFYLSTNPGEEMKPLNRIASGGELSRIILALRKVFMETGSVKTLILDEVDSGIGGATAEVVGTKVKEVSKKHQIICITHLPQIARFGTYHMKVEKVLTGGRTVTIINVLSDKERVEEIARMLAGSDISEASLRYAEELLVSTREENRC